MPDEVAREMDRGAGIRLGRDLLRAMLENDSECEAILAKYQGLVSDADLDRILARVDTLIEASAGYLTPAAAARYLGVPRKRIYNLKSMGALEPDGYDGRTPLFTRATLDHYARKT